MPPNVVTVSNPSNPSFRKKVSMCQSDRLWTVAQMVASYAKARLSGRNASIEVQSLRSESCNACPSFCSNDEGIKWCGACGCGSKREAAIIEGGAGPSKLTFTKLNCPRNRPGFSNEVIDG